MNFESISPGKALEAAKNNQRIAYIGRIGRERKKFCIDYIEQKRKIYRETLEKHKNEQITCVKGCTYCCYEFATADIRACEAIAYYVSRCDELIEKFIKSYVLWREKLAPHAGLVSEICRLQDRVVRGDKTVALELELELELEQHIIEYFNLGNPCPFLENNACLIYEVRPDVCFSQASTTPTEWCSFKTDKVPNVVQLLDKPIITPFYYGRDPNLNTIEIMTETVYRLLTDGYRYLDKIQALHGIYGEHIRDADVRSCIEEMRKEK